MKNKVVPSKEAQFLEFGYEQAGINKTKLRGRKIWKLNQKPTKIVNL